MEIKACYGKKAGRLDACGECALKAFCDAAGDPPPLSKMATTFENIEYAERYATPPEFAEPQSERHAGRQYSRGELLELLAFLLCLDEPARFLLDAKIKDPDITLAELGERKNVSRQAVHKMILKKCREIPELETALRNRRHRLAVNQQKTFLEEVCQIRKKTSEMKSKKPKTGSEFCASLMSLRQNLDLSRLSICKGAAS